MTGFKGLWHGERKLVMLELEHGVERSKTQGDILQDMSRRRQRQSKTEGWIMIAAILPEIKL